MPARVLKDKLGRFVVADGSVLRFSPDFVENYIGKKRYCFFCGAEPGTKVFDREHVVPAWIISKYGLEEMEIVLPNGEATKFTQTKIPSCKECNKRLGKEFEEKVPAYILNGELPRLSYSKYDNKRERLFCWLALIWAKYVLKSHQQRMVINDKNNLRSIGDHLETPGGPHVLSYVQTFVHGGGVSDTAQGSIFVFDVQYSIFDAMQPFSIDVYSVGSAIMLRFRDLAIIALLDDGGCSQRSLQGFMETHLPNEKLTEFQLYELFARLSIFSDQFSPFIDVTWDVDTLAMIGRGHFINNDPIAFVNSGASFDEVMCGCLGHKSNLLDRGDQVTHKARARRAGNYTYFKEFRRYLD